MFDPRNDHPTDELLQEFLDGELDRSTRETLEGHLAHCERCQVQLEIWRSLFTEIDQLPDLVPQIEFQARVLARLETQEPVNDKSSWLMIGQAGLALILVAYAWLVNPIELSLEYIPIWMDRLLQFLLSTTDEVLLGIEESFQQFLALSPTRSELFASVPEIPLGGTLLIYAVLLAVLLWIVSNHLLFQTNGQHEESQS